MSNEERKLATVRRIKDIQSIPDADRIEVVTVGGWNVVTPKGQFSIGDLAVYFEIDSFLPDKENEAWQFLIDKSSRVFNEKKGHVLKTMKLRGVFSQGLLLPLDCVGNDITLQEGDDLTEILGIEKYEKPIPANLSGLVKGNFPSWGKRTDQERAENFEKEIKKAYDNDIVFEVSIKLDGSSVSCGTSVDGEYVVCSRNLSLKTEQEGNSFIDVFRKYDMEEKTKKYKGYFFSGELMGEGVQGNKEKLKGRDVFIFDIYKENSYISSKERLRIIEEFGLKHVPILHEEKTLKELGLHRIEDILEFANGKSLNNKKREGVVFKSIDGSFSFKAISKDWLIKYE